MRIIERNPGGKEGIIEVTKEDYEESLRKHPHPGCECHVKKIVDNIYPWATVLLAQARTVQISELFEIIDGTRSRSVFHDWSCPGQ